jgi:hypothetical protein
MSNGKLLHEQGAAGIGAGPEATGPDHFASWGAFMGRVEKRLEIGKEAYGDKSFTRPAGELVGEIEAELLDLCGWSFILWCRLRKIKQALGEEHGSDIRKSGIRIG